MMQRGDLKRKYHFARWDANGSPYTSPPPLPPPPAPMTKQRPRARNPECEAIEPPLTPSWFGQLLKWAFPL